MPLSPDHADKSPELSLLPRRPLSREAAVGEALQCAPGRPVVLLRPAPVKVRSVTGLALAYTVTHVLVELDDGGRHHVRWEATWLVRRL